MDDLELNFLIDSKLKEAEVRGAQKIINWLRAQHWICKDITEQFQEWGVK